MKRFIEDELLKWKEDPQRLPLLIRGARQVGKTYIIELFGKETFESAIFINFELQPEYKSCFERLDPQSIVKNLELMADQKIEPGHTLLFFDEIQECPNAIMSLRYFKEKMPQIHVIGAGSLLEFAIEDEFFSFPTGRVQFMNLCPLSFREYLLAMGGEKLHEYLKEVTLTNPPTTAVHEHLLKFVREYFFIGGMPAVVHIYKHEHSMLKCTRRQGAIYQTYKTDFGKYASKTEYRYLQRFYERAPFIVAKHFQYAKIDSEMRARNLKIALHQLCQANLLYQIFSTNSNGLPLEATINEKKFKLIFLDIGLLQTALKLDPLSIGHEDLVLIHEGALAEQFVGQELLAYQDCYLEKKLYFWERNQASDAEVDFVVSFNSTIVPIEVKAGSSGKLKSLYRFMEEKHVKIGVRISQNPLSLEKNILSIPFYLIAELPRLLKDEA